MTSSVTGSRVVAVNGVSTVVVMGSVAFSRKSMPRILATPSGDMPLAWQQRIVGDAQQF